VTTHVCIVETRHALSLDKIGMLLGFNRRLIFGQNWNVATVQIMGKIGMFGRH